MLPPNRAITYSTGEDGDADADADDDDDDVALCLSTGSDDGRGRDGPPPLLAALRACSCVGVGTELRLAGCTTGGANPYHATGNRERAQEKK